MFINFLKLRGNNKSLNIGRNNRHKHKDVGTNRSNPAGGYDGRYLRHLVVALIILPIVLRVIFYYDLPLQTDEAFYWAMSQDIEWSYYQHTAMVAFLLLPVGWAIEAWGWQGDLVIHLYATCYMIISGLILSYLFSQIIKNDLTPIYNLSSEKQQRAVIIFAYALLMSPMFFLNGSIWTHDTPFVLLLSWTFLAYYLALRAGVPSKNKHLGYSINWSLCGLAFGLALAAKYSTIIWGAAAFLHLVFSASGRRALGSYGPWLALLITIVCLLPVIIWNMNNEWASLLIRYEQLNNRGSLSNSANFGATLISLLLISGVSLIYLLSRGIIKEGKNLILSAATDEALSEEQPISQNLSWLLWQIFFPIVFFLSLSLFVGVYFNWFGISLALYLMLFSLFCVIFDEGKKIKLSMNRGINWVIGGHFLWQAIIFVGLFYVFYGGIPVATDRRIFDYQQFADELSLLEESHPDAYLLGKPYQPHAALSWAKKDLLPYRNLGWRITNYDFMDMAMDEKIPDGADVLIFSFEDDPVSRYADYFDEVEQLDPVDIRFRTKSQTRFYVYFGQSLRGDP